MGTRGALASGLPEDVDMMSTDPTVCSPELSRADADASTAELGGRKPVVWDNYPVNDGTMGRSLHLGPYRGREPELTEAVDGVLLNPMTQARAWWVGLDVGAPGPFTLYGESPMILVRAGRAATRVTMDQVLPFRDRRLE